MTRWIIGVLCLLALALLVAGLRSKKGSREEAAHAADLLDAAYDHEALDAEDYDLGHPDWCFYCKRARGSDTSAS